jgi:hypothetical protein
MLGAMFFGVFCYMFFFKLAENPDDIAFKIISGSNFLVSTSIITSTTINLIKKKTVLLATIFQCVFCALTIYGIPLTIWGVFQIKKGYQPIEPQPHSV